MYLAGILGLCALLCVPAYGHARGEFSSSAVLSVYCSPQNPTPPPATPPAQQTQPGQEPTPDAPPQDQPSAADARPSPAKPKTAARVRKSTSKKHPATAPGEEPPKRVIHRGSTVEPTTQLSPGITEEQAARQRENTNKLLASTDASLQKLSGRQLSKDEQETVAQIRRFMQQVKTADAAGDLQRAYKLAVKAHLLSDALTKP